MKGNTAVVQNLGKVRPEGKRPVVVIESHIILAQPRLHYSQQMKSIKKVSIHAEDSST
jgi:hypothetical protein